MSDRSATLHMSVDVHGGDRKIAEASIMLQRLGTQLGENVKLRGDELPTEDTQRSPSYRLGRRGGGSVVPA